MDNSFEKIREVITIYHCFADIAIDIHAIHYDPARVSTFKHHAEEYFKKFKKLSRGQSTSSKPYLHILREHIPTFMQFWGEKLKWGYGYFNCNGGEHLNKRIKVLEVNSTNMDNDRFVTIMEIMRLKQFYFPESICSEKESITCSACKQQGHNKKNKNCIMHPNQPEPYFSDSDEAD